MSKTIVGYNWHEFHGEGDHCEGILSGIGTECGALRGNIIHSDERKPQWMKDKEAEQSQFSKQVGGDHYKKMAIQPLEFIAKNGLDFFQGNVLKYILRYKAKNGVEDLKKARHYIDMMIELTEKNE